MTHNEERTIGVACAKCGKRPKKLCSVDGKLWCPRHKPKKPTTTSPINGLIVTNDDADVNDQAELFGADDHDSEGA